MQILPFAENVLAEKGETFTSANLDSYASQAENQSFAELFEKASTISAEITPVLDDFLDIARTHAKDLERAIASAPYSSTRESVNARFEQEEIRFTAEEIKQFADNLEKQGMDQKTVQAVKNLADSDLGVTTADIMQVIMQSTMQPVRLDDHDLQNIYLLGSSVMQGNGDKNFADDLVGAVRQGRGVEAFQAFMQQLNSAEPGQALTVRRDELLSFGKGIGLSDKALAKIAGMFGDRSELALVPDDLRRVFADAAQELGAKTEAQKKMAFALEKALAPVQQEARRRMELERNATERKSREVDHAVTLIQDTVTRNSFIRQQDGAEGASSVAQTAQKETSHHKVRESTQSTDQPALQRAESAEAAKGSVKGLEPFGQSQISEQPEGVQKDIAAFVQAGPEGEQSGMFGKHGFGREESDSSLLRKHDAWGGMLDKVEVKSTHFEQNMQAGFAQSVLSSPGAQPLAGPLDPKTLQRNVAPRMLEQVEQGMLSAMKNGGKRLELQLAPSELGLVNVILTTKNGEISAMLRPEKAETAALLNQQAEQLRFALEQQGLKVDKVEVQTQLQDERNMSTWQGMDQHNQTRDQQERMDLLERHRRMARMQQSGISETALARNMQNIETTATIAERGLYIVA